MLSLIHMILICAALLVHFASLIGITWALLLKRNLHMILYQCFTWIDNISCSIKQHNEPVLLWTTSYL